MVLLPSGREPMATGACVAEQEPSAAAEVHLLPCPVGGPAALGRGPREAAQTFGQEAAASAVASAGAAFDTPAAFDGWQVAVACGCPCPSEVCCHPPESAACLPDVSRVRVAVLVQAVISDLVPVCTRSDVDTAVYPIRYESRPRLGVL